MNLFSYWTGEVSWMERLSVASAQAVGHDVTVYSEAPDLLIHRGIGCRVLHASAVWNDPGFERLRREHPAHYSDQFRLAGLQQGLGVWVDLDLVFLKPLPDDPYLMGWEAPGSVNNAVLRLPENSAILTDYRNFCLTRPFNVKWHPLADRIKRRLKRVSHALQGKKQIAPLLGPATLTHFVKKHALESKVKPQQVFYPLPYGRDHLKNLILPGAMEQLIGPQTIAVHLWRSLFRKVYGKDIPGDWLQGQLAQYKQAA